MIEWISVKEKPLVYTSPTGTRYPTEAGKCNFFAAIPRTATNTGESYWTTMYVTLDNECNIRDADYEKYEEYGIDTYYSSSVDEITHYIPKPEPPKMQ